MVRVTVNGEARVLAEDAASVAALVRLLGFEGKRVAVERNGEIVPKSRYDATPLADGDTLEIVRAVGGG
jgi:sulfur carrier protein